MKFHPFHILDLSPWPVLTSMALMSSMLHSLFYILGKESIFWFCFGITSCFLPVMGWIRDIIRESTFQGNHTVEVYKLIKLGFLFFILSEVMFFMSFFFCIVFMMAAPDIELGCNWPPLGVSPVSYMEVPLMNSILLLSSGVSITWSHYSLLNSNFKDSIYGMIVTVILSCAFTMFQFGEYNSCSFTMADSVYGSVFFVSTGFHGIHVIVGTLFISVSIIRMVKLHFSESHHLGIESSIWYWHFVDVVWLILFLLIYYL